MGIEIVKGFKRLCNDSVLILPDPDPTRTLSGLYLPVNIKERRGYRVGTVIMTGPGRRGKDGQRIPVEVKQGDRVLWVVFGHRPITVSGVNHILVDSLDVQALIEGEKDGSEETTEE